VFAPSSSGYTSGQNLEVLYILNNRNNQNILTLLDMAGGLLAPPFFKGQIVKKTLSAKNLKKFLSLLLDLFFVHYASIFIKTI
jgi:hypothetical protein